MVGAVMTFNAEENDDTVFALSGAEGNLVKILVSEEDYSPEAAKKLLASMAKTGRWMLEVVEKGWDGNTGEEMLKIFSYPDEGTALYTNITKEVDVTVEDIQKVLAEVTAAQQMSLGEALDVIKSAGLAVKK
jgi:hypothetical protein